MSPYLSPRQKEFIYNSTKKINIAHGPVRSGKTVGSLFRFMQAAYECPDSSIWMIGHSSTTIYHNCVRLLLEATDPTNPLYIFNPFLTWYSHKRELKFRNKTIATLGAKDEGAIKAIQGKSFSVAYCDEITLYPESIIDMIQTRLSNPHSKLFASCNPSYPTHKIKQWIDFSEKGDTQYYSLQFMLDHNPYLDETYKKMIRESLSSLFYKRNYLGLWCAAEGAIFDFFDPKYHIVERPPCAAEYWIASIDYGVSNPFCCLLIGVNTGIKTQSPPQLWVEKEYYWDHKKTDRQLTNSEFADAVQEFIGDYYLKNLYLDPSAASFQVELRKKGIHVTHAENDVLNGIITMTDMMKKGLVKILKNCTNLIREIERYSWDPKESDKGYDEPIKKDDHAVDALRYALFSHKISAFDPYKISHNPNDYIQNRFQQPGRRF